MTAADVDRACASLWGLAVAAIGTACPPPVNVAVSTFESAPGKVWLTVKVDVAAADEVPLWADYFGLAAPAVVTMHQTGRGRRKTWYRSTRVEGRLPRGDCRVDVVLWAWQETTAPPVVPPAGRPASGTFPAPGKTLAGVVPVDLTDLLVGVGTGGGRS